MSMRPFERPPVVVGHRGAPEQAPENTPASFLAAVELGATWVELDVRRSADGELVCHHDAHTPDGVPLVARSADELALVGVWSLPAVLDALPAGLGVDVEVKNLPGEPDFDEEDGLVEELATILTSHRHTRPWMTSSFNPRTVAALGAALPDVPAGLLHLASLDVRGAVAIAAEYGAAVLGPQAGASGLDDEGVAACHDRGLSVLVWTVDEAAQAVGLANAGVDAICTNRPDVVAAALARRSPGRPRNVRAEHTES